ncbi:2-hydroxychromene-2-carboxylate isomerase [Magnetospirillum moscoviense]|uniref:2-hydroxychromene-2-carboxylate isomerase n=1 Tax=Magnetospirillum moscoviense TaxID=1437059 RepID=A0A178MDZ7_9PROT|nr:2-hydroxychromene-2-carboxylate isomerase [Magnetospirillum moscoviense]OAN47041.1 2-hydroxychromene-2-carboxylate isomerase [Magnetospirillum moscoviense]
MPAPIEFFFDFSSPYAYFASHRIDELAARFGRDCLWKPMLLGPAFKASGNQRLIDQPLKGAYSTHDWERMARWMKVPYRLPEPFPVATTSAARAFWWLDSTEPRAAKSFARAVFAAYFEGGRDISAKAEVVAIGAAQACDAQALAAAIDEPVWKDKCRAETDAAIARGVFGSPFFFVDGEGFWGADRLGMLAEWLESGGW